MRAEIEPSATEEETAAIVAALEMLWPRPVVRTADLPRRTPVWRFSGRWWAKPVPARRDRPWY
jgi:hypothetical protein